jgi:hypothetical protein
MFSKISSLHAELRQNAARKDRKFEGIERQGSATCTKLKSRISGPGIADFPSGSTLPPSTSSCLKSQLRQSVSWTFLGISSAFCVLSFSGFRFRFVLLVSLSVYLVSLFIVPIQSIQFDTHRDLIISSLDKSLILFHLPRSGTTASLLHAIASFSLSCRVICRHACTSSGAAISCR